MKKLKRLLSMGIIFALVMAMGFSLVACNNKVDKPGGTIDPPAAVVVSIDNAPDTISAGETVKFTATVANATDTSVIWSVSDPETLMITEDGEVSVLKAPELLDKNVTVTATSVADSKASDSKPIRVKAPTKEGKVGRLTGTAIQAAGSANITASGTVTDYYIDKHDSSLNRANSYESIVAMEDGKWSGSWRHKLTEEEGESEEGYITNAYERGPANVRYEVYNFDGTSAGYNTGYETLEKYINKDNEVASKRYTDNMSVPLAWETQHLWNHIDKLDVTKFTYDPEEPSIYTYELTDKSTDAENYLMAYLVVSLTPMLTGEDSFRSVSLTLDESDRIVKISGQSNIVYAGAEYNQSGTLVDYDSMSYTTVELDLTNIGTTVIKEVTPYTADANADKLAAALEKMKNATSYSYSVTDTTTTRPTPDDGDYSTEAISLASMTMAPHKAAVNCTVKPANRTSASGTVGTRGWVTSKAVLVEKTSKYDYAMDDKVYKIEYSGYRQFEGYYEEFVYDKSIKDGTGAEVGGLRGERRVSGNMMSIMPGFDFSASLFSCTTSGDGKKQQYTFTLKETAVTRDIARQIAVYNASDAQAVSGSALTLTVDADGNLIRARYPYSINLGTYIGYCTITFSGVGETTIEMSNIDTNYAERGERTSWNQYDVKYYDDENGNRVDPMNAQAAIENIYKDNASDMPTAGDILSIFGDNFSGPFYDDREIENPDGTTKKRRSLSLTLRSVVLDDNGQVANFDELIAECDKVFGKLGYTKDLNLTDVSGGESGRSSRYVVYTTSKMTIVIENNFTKNFWMYFYNAGEYPIA